MIVTYNIRYFVHHLMSNASIDYRTLLTHSLANTAMCSDLNTILADSGVTLV